MKYLDPVLHDDGVAQCKEASESFKLVDVKYCLISPMKRTIQTAYLLFSPHPKYTSIHFILCPPSKEVLNTANDTSSNLHDLIQFARDLGIDIDCSWMYMFGVVDMS